MSEQMNGQEMPSATPESAESASAQTITEAPFQLIEELLPHSARNMVRVLYAVMGVAALLLGGVLFFWPGATLAVVAVLVGIDFIVDGAVRVISSIVELGLPTGWRVLSIIIGAFFIFGGVIMMKNAAISAQALALVATITIGIGWVLEGIIALAESWQRAKNGWAVLYAILSILAGVIVLVFPIGSALWLILFASGMLVVSGVLLLVRAFMFARRK